MNRPIAKPGDLGTINTGDLKGVLVKYVRYDGGYHWVKILESRKTSYTVYNVGDVVVWSAAWVDWLP